MNTPARYPDMLSKQRNALPDLPRLAARLIRVQVRLGIQVPSAASMCTA